MTTGAPSRRIRPLSDAGALGRGLPFAAVAVIAVALALVPPAFSADTSQLRTASFALAGLLVASAAIPWQRLPDWSQAAPPLSFFVVVALLRHGGGGAVSGFAALVLLPILWMAIYGGRTELGLAIAGAAVTLVAPIVVVGGELYPSSGWRASVLWVVIGLLAGSTTQNLVDQSRQRTADIAALGVVTRALATGADPRPQLCAAAQMVTGAAFAVLFEPRAGDVLVATAGTAGLDLAPMQIDPSTESSATGEAWRTGNRIYLPDSAAEPRTSLRLLAHTGAVSVLFEPVGRGESRTAVLVIAFREQRPRLPASALYMVELVAAEIAVAIDRSDLVASLASQARTDPLTGAANRRSWDEVMDRELARAQRTGEPLTVALLDMDHFKAYNDSQGHNAGDVLLREVVHAIRAELRTGDVIARWGGEEFAIALPSCGLEQGRALADRLLRVIPGGQTGSIGLTQAGGFDTPRSVIGRADRALYVAKENGRDQIASFDAPTEPHQPLVARRPG
ncbi:MAG: diguanylate cyclase domain-containing protein [Cellulomonas sp.]